MKLKITHILWFSLLLANLTFAQTVGEKLTLAQCIQLAAENNPSLRQSALSVAQARLVTKQAYSGLYPATGVSASTSSGSNSQTQPEWESQWSIQGSIEQNLYRPGLYSGIQQAKVNAEIAKISAADLQSQIRLSVENYFYQILSAYALIGVYQENIQSSAENLEKIRLMYKVGARTESDVLKAEVQKSDFEALLISEQERLGILRRSLNTLMGRSPEIDFWVEDVSAPSESLPELSAAKAILLEKNREYQALQQNYKSHKISVKIAREAYLPSVAGYFSRSQTGRWEDSTPQTSTQIGLRASIDLFDGFNKRQNVQIEKINLDKLKIDLEATARELTAELNNYYSNLKTYDGLIRIDEKNVESSRRDLALVTERYAVGASTILDQMNAQASLLQSQSSLVKDKYSRKVVEAQIRQLLGL